MIEISLLAQGSSVVLTEENASKIPRDCLQRCVTAAGRERSKLPRISMAGIRPSMEVTRIIPPRDKALKVHFPSESY